MGGFARHAGEIISSDLNAPPEMRPFAEVLKAPLSILVRIKVLDWHLPAIARRTLAVRLSMTAPGVG